MTLYTETKNFFIFVLLGILFSLIFDIFRAIRRVKKPKRYALYTQDIIYFLIVGIILLTMIINILDSDIRLYNMLAIVLGVIIYISIFGNSIRNIFCNLFKLSGKIIEFLLLPITIYKVLFKKQINKLKKIVKNCCKKISYMINSKYAKIKTKLFKKKIKTKEDFINDKKTKSSY